MPVPRRQPPHPKPAATPLDQRAAQVNARVALDIVRNTSLPDNLAFFTHKLRAWLLYSTPELQVSYKLRAIRLFEWLSIAAAAIVLASRWRRGTASLLPCAPGKTPEKLGILLLLLLLTLAMAVQLTPVLYNTRYNTYFMEPWLMLLCGASVGILLHDPAPQASAPAGTRGARLSQRVRRQWRRWALVGMLVGLAVAIYYIFRVEFDTIPWLGISGLRMEPWFQVQSTSAGVFGVAAGFLCIILVSLFTKAPSQETEAFLDRIRRIRSPEET